MHGISRSTPSGSACPSTAGGSRPNPSADTSSCACRIHAPPQSAPSSPALRAPPRRSTRRIRPAPRRLRRYTAAQIARIVIRSARHRRRNHALDRQPILRRKLEVALIMRRHAHNRARAVVRQDVIRHPDRQRLAVERIHRHLAPSRTPCFSMVPMSPASRAAFCSAIIFSTAGASSASDVAHCLHQRMLRSKLDRRRAEDRIDPRREHRDRQRVRSTRPPRN